MSGSPTPASSGNSSDADGQVSGPEQTELSFASAGLRDKILLRRATMRSELAQAVLIAAGVIAVVALACVLILINAVSLTNEQAVALFQTTFGLIFGAVSAWGGAIIAFYFGGENFDAGARATENLIQITKEPQGLKAVKANDAMVRLDQLKAIHNAATGPAAVLAAVNLQEVSEVYAEPDPRRRAIVLDGHDRFVAVLHKATYLEFESAAIPAGSTPATVSLNALIAAIARTDPNTAALVTTPAYCGPDDTLDFMRAQMTKIPGCQDGFVTNTGQAGGVVLGYITNVTISERAQVAPVSNPG